MSARLFLFLTAAMGFGAMATEEPTPIEQRNLETEIARHQAELNRLRDSRKKLESSVRSKDGQIRRLDRQRRTYEENLKRSRSESEILERELQELESRIQEDRSLLTSAQEVGLPRPDRTNALNGARRTAAEDVMATLLRKLSRTESQAARLREEYRAAVAYQTRIETKYMPNEEGIKEGLAKRLESEQSRLERQAQRETQVASDLRALRARAQALHKALENLRPSRDRLASRSQAPAIRTGDFKPGVPFSALRTKLPSPANGRLLRGFGPYTHPAAGVTMQNLGLDIELSDSQEVHAVADGRVLFSGEYPGYGVMVALDHGEGYVTVYGGVAGDGLKAEQVVKAGQQIGSVPTRDNRTVLHFEIRKDYTAAIDPALWLGPQ